jgi:Cyclic nucleotide-binding domain
MGQDQLPSVPQIAQLLKQLFLFKELGEAQLAHIVTRFQPVLYLPDKPVISEDTKGETFYIIYKGKVRVDRTAGGEERFLSALGVGEYFGEESLLYNRSTSASVTTVESTILLQLDLEMFYLTLQEFPQIRAILTITAESRHLAQRQDFDWLGIDEVVHLVKRKHEIFLYVSFIAPLAVFLLSFPVLAYGLSSLGETFWQKAAIFLGISGFIFSIIWFVWNWVDWGNDFYIVTNQRVVRVEKVVLLYNSRSEAPLHHVLAVNVNKPFLGQVLNYGDIEVRTFTGGIRMPRASKPDLFPAYIEGYKARSGYLSRQTELETMRRELRERMGRLPLESSSQQASMRRLPTRRRTRKPIKPGSFRDIVNTLFVIRYEKGKVITYRKHWLLLLRKTWIPTTFMLFTMLLAVYQVDEYVLGRPGFFSSAPMFVLYAIIFLSFFAWWIYGYLDWSNDIYQLAPDQIRDIERKPLGDEIKKTAPLESILSVEHFRDGIIQLYFNFGYVYINVGETQFVFRGVYNPDQVHQDISDYLEALSQRKREKQAERERDRMLDWLTTYKSEDELLELLESEKDWDLFPG